jgi:hypothetical protein
MLHEMIAADPYFSSEKSIEGYHCAQVFKMTSKMLFVAGIKTESEFFGCLLRLYPTIWYSICTQKR